MHEKMDELELKAGTYTVRFKAGADLRSISKARIRVSLGGISYYTKAGELDDEVFKQYETEITISSAGTKYFYVYNYVDNTTVYIKDVEVLGKYEDHAEAQFTVANDAIEAEVKRAEGIEDELRAAIKVNAGNITSKVEKGDMGSYITQYYNNVLIAFNKDSKYVQISAGAFDGAVYIEPWEWGRYPSSLMGSKHVSMSGKHPDSRINRATVRARSKAAGEGYYSMDSTSYWAYSMLVLVKYASLNTQEKVCKGYYYLRYTDQDKALVAEQSTNRIVIALATAANEYLVGNAVEIGTSLGGAQVAKQRLITRVEDYSNGSVTGKAIYFDGDPVNIAVGNIISHCANISGTTDSLGMRDGCLANDGKHAMLLLGHEHNGQYAFVDNVNRYQGTLYVCYDNTATKDNVGDTDPNYKALSFAFPTTSGWQLLEGFDPEHPLEMWCEKLGGSSVGKGNGAYLWSNNNAAWFVLYVFGYANNGAIAGLPYVSASSGSGYAYWNFGGVLLKKRQ